MTDTDTRAHHCKRLMDDPYLQEAFNLVREAIHEGFESLSPLEDTVVQMNAFQILRLRLQVLDSVWDNLEHAIREQKIEAFNLELTDAGNTH